MAAARSKIRKIIKLGRNNLIYELLEIADNVARSDFRLSDKTLIKFLSIYS